VARIIPTKEAGMKMLVLLILGAMILFPAIANANARCVEWRHGHCVVWQQYHRYVPQTHYYHQQPGVQAHGRIIVR
jgi:hypothetical protein